jgi:TatD DNase family protein
LLETDAPYLAPVPNRGKRNEPAYLYEIALKLAEIKDFMLDEITNQTSINAKKLFNI